MYENIRELTALFNLELSDNLFFEAWPLSAEVCIIRFANRKESIRIYHKLTRYKMIQGGIIMWHGTLANIPAEYALCDGTNGTPDLRDKFVVGSANGVDPGGVGGAVNHNHTFTGDGHSHTFHVGTGVAAGTDIYGYTTIDPAIGTTDNEDGRPPFYEIAYIMKL